MNTPNIDELIRAWQDSEKGATLDDISHALWVLCRDLRQLPENSEDITTLRGLVLVEGEKSGASVMHADETGLSIWSGDIGMYTWCEVKENGWTVRKLTKEDL